MDATSVWRRAPRRRAALALFSICLAVTTLGWWAPSAMAAAARQEPPSPGSATLLR